MPDRRSLLRAVRPLIVLATHHPKKRSSIYISPSLISHLLMKKSGNRTQRRRGLPIARWCRLSRPIDTAGSLLATSESHLALDGRRPRADGLDQVLGISASTL